MSINYEQLGNSTQIGKRDFSTHGFVLRTDLGLVTGEYLDDQIVHRARDPEGDLFECRGTIAPDTSMSNLICLKK